MKRFAALGMVLVIVLAIAVASIGCSCNESIGPTPQPDISTPTPQPETATPTPTPTIPPEQEYNTTRDTMQNAVTVYVENHGGSHPPKVGDITINQEVRYIFDICSLLEANGGTLTQIPDCMASVDGDNNDNFDLGDCRLGLEGLYIWAIDEQGNIYSACIGNGCSAQYEDGYQRLSEPQLGSPLNGANISDNTPLLTWSSVDGATGYVIQVSTDPGFSPASMIIDSTLGNVQGLEFGYELANGTYFWHVKGINACTESLWSEMGAFTLDYSAPTPTPTPSEAGCTLETAQALVAPWADMESKSMKNDVIVSFGEQSFSSTTWQKGDHLIRIEMNGSVPEWPEGQVWLVNMSSASSVSYYYYPAESRAEITCNSPTFFNAPLMMAYWLASPDAQLENCSFSCETYNDTECLVIQFPEDFDNMRLWIEMSSGLPVHFQVEEPEEGVITYDYRNIDLSDIPDSMFQLPEGTTISGEDSSCQTYDEYAYDAVTSDIATAVVWYASENLGVLPILSGTYTNAECSACNIVDMSALLVENGGIFSGVPDGLWQGPGASDDNCDASGGSISGCSASNHYVWIIDPVGNVYSYCQGVECTSSNSGYQGVWP